MKEKVRKSMITKICDLLSCFIIVIIMVAGSCLYLPKCLGYKTYCVLGTSMEREIPLGSLVYMKEVPKEMIKEGDVIVFKNAKGETVEAVEVQTEDCSYLVKISQRLESVMELFEEDEDYSFDDDVSFDEPDPSAVDD